MLPRGDRVVPAADEKEAPARIFTAAGRAELWAAGSASSPSPSTAHENHPSPLAMREEPIAEVDILEMDQDDTPFRRTSNVRTI
jgi:hypothetical protein